MAIFNRICGYSIFAYNFAVQLCTNFDLIVFLHLCINFCSLIPINVFFFLENQDEIGEEQEDEEMDGEDAGMDGEDPGLEEEEEAEEEEEEEKMEQN